MCRCFGEHITSPRVRRLRAACRAVSGWKRVLEEDTETLSLGEVARIMAIQVIIQSDIEKSHVKNKVQSMYVQLLLCIRIVINLLSMYNCMQFIFCIIEQRNSHL